MKDNHFSFRANKKNAHLKQALKDLAEKANRKFNDYLNVILAKHVEDKRNNKD